MRHLQLRTSVALSGVAENSWDGIHKQPGLTLPFGPSHAFVGIRKW